MEEERRHEMIIIAAALILAGLLVIFNVLTAPPLQPAVVSYSAGEAPSAFGAESTSAAEPALTTFVHASPTGEQISDETPDADFPVDLNSADSQALQALPGIGPAKAEAIITYRNENGGFYSVDELLNVNGIGEQTLEKLRPYVTVA